MRSHFPYPFRDACCLLRRRLLRQARRGAVSRARARPRRCFGRWAASRRRRSRSRSLRLLLHARLERTTPRLKSWCMMVSELLMHWLLANQRMASRTPSQE